MKEIDDLHPIGTLSIVKVEAASLNHWNTKFRSGFKKGFTTPYGSMIVVAGVLVHYEPVSYDRFPRPNFRAGDRVVGVALRAGIIGDLTCKEKEDSDFVYDTDEEGLRTGWSDYAYCSPYDILHIPSHISFEQAAVFPGSYMEANAAHYEHVIDNRKPIVVLRAETATAYILAKIFSKKGICKVYTTCSERDYNRLQAAGFENVLLHGSPELKRVAGKGCNVIDVAGGKPLQEIAGYLPRGSNVLSSLDFEFHREEQRRLLKKRRITINMNTEYELYTETYHKMKQREVNTMDDIYRFIRDTQEIVGGWMYTMLNSSDNAPIGMWALIADIVPYDSFWPLQPRCFSLEQIHDAHLLIDACPWAGPVAICMDKSSRQMPNRYVISN